MIPGFCWALALLMMSGLILDWPTMEIFDLVKEEVGNSTQSLVFFFFLLCLCNYVVEPNPLILYSFHQDY